MPRVQAPKRSTRERPEALASERRIASSDRASCSSYCAGVPPRSCPAASRCSASAPPGSSPSRGICRIPRLPPPRPDRAGHARDVRRRRGRPRADRDRGAAPRAVQRGPVLLHEGQEPGSPLVPERRGGDPGQEPFAARRHRFPKRAAFAILFVDAAALAAALFLPGLARAQATGSIAGIVRDTTGAVLPGVTVEAASPALIERLRTAMFSAAFDVR